ncbi:hypothetical protein D3C86_1979180 [compost metagenome]
MLWNVETPTRSKSLADKMSLSLLLMLMVAALVNVTIHGRAEGSSFNNLTIPATHVVDFPDPGSATVRLLPGLDTTASAINACSSDNIYFLSLMVLVNMLIYPKRIC